MRKRACSMGLAAALLLAAAVEVKAEAAQAAPLADHHQHVFSKETIALVGQEAGLRELPAREVLRLLDAAGIRKAVLLSTAYMYGSPARQVEDEYARVRRENDWTAAQAAQFPDRLLAFCGIAPLKDYALDEIERCARAPGLKRGIKLHLGNSDVQLDDPAHVARLRQVFAAANARVMAIVVHLRANIGKKRPYGEKQARIFLERVLPAAPDVVVQVAHLAGAGPGFEDPPAREVLAVLARAAGRGEPATRNLWFDVASAADRALTPQAAAEMAARIRQIGVDRVLYGTDSAQGDNLRPREAWAAFRRLPLTEAEFAHIARNVPPYFR